MAAEPELSKAYDHRDVEPRWYRTWLQRGYFHADEKYTVVQMGDGSEHLIRRTLESSAAPTSRAKATTRPMALVRCGGPSSAASRTRWRRRSWPASSPAATRSG